MAENNWITNFIDWIDSGSVTDAPLIYQEVSALMILSCIVNRNIFVNFGHRHIYPSLWCVLLGKSGMFRKSTMIDLVSKFVLAIKPDFVMEQESSSEYFATTLAEKSKVLFVQDEFISLLDSFKKEYSSLTKRLLVELYDREIPWSRGTMGGGKVEIIDPFVNIITGTTPAWLQQAISESDIKGGFLPRFLLIYANEKERNIQFPGFGNEKVKNNLIEGLDMLSKITYQAQLSKEAEEIYVQFSHYLDKITKEKGDIIGSFNSRLCIYSLKLALLYHVSDLERIADEVISEEDMQKGVSFAKRVCATQEKILSNLAFSPYQIKRQRILDILEFSGKEGMQYSVLLRKLQMPTRELMVIIESLQIEEVVTMQQKKGAGKKPSNWLCLSEHLPKEE